MTARTPRFLVTIQLRFSWSVQRCVHVTRTITIRFGVMTTVYTLQRQAFSYFSPSQKVIGDYAKCCNTVGLL